MSAIEELTAAIDKLERRVKGVLGLMEVGADTSELYALVESDHDGNGDLTGIDSDEEINEAIVTLHRTIDAQLAILQAAAGEIFEWAQDPDVGYKAERMFKITASGRAALTLARAINGDTQ